MVSKERASGNALLGHTAPRSPQAWVEAAPPLSGDALFATALRMWPLGLEGPWETRERFQSTSGCWLGSWL